MKIAIIGAGRIGFKHLEIYMKNRERYSLDISFSRTSCKNVLETYKKMIEESGKGKDYFDSPCIGFKNWNEMIDENPDIVDICSPDEYHFSHIKYALDKTKKIICEKPLVLPSEIKECKKIIYAAGKGSVEIITNLQMLSMKSMLEKKLAEKDIDYKNIEKQRPYKFTWITNGNGNSPIVDIMPHILSIYNFNIDGMKKEILNDKLTKFTTDEGRITIGYGPEKIRKWKFGEDNFSYIPKDGHTEVHSSRLNESLAIKDPLEEYLVSFIEGKPYANMMQGLENAVKVAEISQIY